MFKIIEILSCQGVVQSEPHVVWIITIVINVQSKKCFLYSLPRKKISFSYGNLRLFQTSNFKNRSFLSGQEVVQIKPNLVWSILRVDRLCNKKFGPPNFSRKNLIFQSEISTYSLIIRLFYFQKYRNFIGSRSCSNQTKLGMEYQQCN